MAGMAMFLCAACDSNQKPTPRLDAKKDTVANIVVSDDGSKILIPFRRNEGELAEVQISLNGVPFNMWWDTGCSITSISALELLKMAKEGKIKDRDLVGKIETMIADGSTTQELVVNIKQVYIAGQDSEHYLVLDDIMVSVSASEDAPSLIGQNIIQKLPKHSFNEDTGTIEFEI